MRARPGRADAQGPDGGAPGDRNGVHDPDLNGILIAGTPGLALWLWSQDRMSVGDIALATGLAMRIADMSGWIMWVVNGIFENVGTVQDGIRTIAGHGWWRIAWTRSRYV